MNKKLFLFVAFLTCCFLAKATERPPQTRWTFKNPFEQKVFVENKGQYFLKGKAPNEQILFGARQDGLQYFFTVDGIWIKYLDKVERTKREIEKFERSIGEADDKDGEERVDNVAKYKWVERFYRMEFDGAGKGTTIIPEQEVSQLYNFCPDNKTNLSAHAWKKITYKNLFPGIDMEFYFPEDKQGFKYNLIIHPGADPSRVRIKYPGNEGISLTHEGNVQIGSLIGDFTDHAPMASEASTGKPVDCVFLLNKETVSFKLGAYDSSKDLIIDPWTTTPVFTSGNNAYDVDWDNYGNCYAYGGSSPFQVIKFSSAGTMLWTTTMTFSGGTYYGDFAIDRSSGSIYITDGFNSSGAQVKKLNQAGSQVGMYGGNPNFAEMWRIVFSRCTKQAVIAGGGTSTPSYTGCYLDTNLVNMNPVDVINAGNSSLHDMWGIAIDAFGSAYFATAKTQFGSAGFDNIIYKVPTPALSPITWQSPEGYNFVEVASVSYIPSTPNGFNGMTMSNMNLYSYDSYVLKKWNTANGTMAASVNVNGSSASTMSYGGLTSDECDNLFLGVNNQIWQYNSGLSHTNTIAKSGNVYDVNLGKNNILYSCGMGFVSADQLSLLPCSILNTANNIINPGCSQPTGSATVTVSGGTSPYTVSWNTSPPQSGPVATNLPPGTYIATITDNSCIKQTKYDTIVITSTGALPNLTVNSGTICASGSVALTASGATTYTWSPTTGLSTNTGASVTASPTVTTTYTVTGSQAGCNGSVTSTVTVRPLPIVTANSPTVCAGTAATMNATGASTYTWSTGGTGPSLSVSPASTTAYTITGTDANGCISKGTATVTVNPLPVVTATSASICPTRTATITAAGASTYTWNTGATTASIAVTPSVTTVYTVNATNANGCAGSTTTTVTINPNLVVSASNNGPLCAGGTLSFSVSAGVTWSWSGPGGFTSSSQNPGITNATTAASGTYTVNAIDANGCSGSGTTNIIINPLPTPTASNSGPVCANQTITFSGSGGTSYSWAGPGNYTSSQQNPSITNTTANMSGVYTLTVIDNNNCSASTTIQALVNPLPVVTVTSASICLGASASLAASGASTYSWSPAAGLATTTGANVLASPTVSTTYVVTGTNNNSCVNTATSSVTIYPLPKVTVNSTTICAGKFGTMTASGAVTYNWSPATGLNNATGPVVQASPGITTTYTVTGTDAKNCVNTATTAVTVNPLPALMISPQTATGCAPLCVTFSNTTSASGTCSWVFGDGSNSSSCVSTHCFTGKGTFGAVLTLTDGKGCVNTASTSVVVYPVPTADFNSTPQPTTILDPIIQFTNLSGGAVISNWHWSFGEQGATSVSQNPSHVYQNPGMYPVTLVVTSNYGCVDSVTKFIKVDEDFTIYVPSAFTPNSDGTNDIFYAKGEGVKDFKMYIYDRWGELVFYSDDIYKGWDGRFLAKGGDIVQEDVYVWKVEVKSTKGESRALRGTVSLLK